MLRARVRIRLNPIRRRRAKRIPKLARHTREAAFAVARSVLAARAVGGAGARTREHVHERAAAAVPPVLAHARAIDAQPVAGAAVRAAVGPSGRAAVRAAPQRVALAMTRGPAAVEAERARRGAREVACGVAAVQRAHAVTATSIRALSMRPVNQLACSSVVAGRTRTLAAHEARSSPRAVVQAMLGRKGEAITRGARITRRARTHALVARGRCICCGNPSVAHAHSNARAVSATASGAFVRRSGTLDSLPAALAGAEAIDARSVRIAVRRAAWCRSLAAGAAKPSSAHARLAKAATATRAAEGAPCAAATWQHTQYRSHSGGDACLTRACGVGARRRSDAIAAGASALSSIG